MNEATQKMEAVEPEDHLGMTAEQWAQFKAFTSDFGDQDENGVDLSLLRENLKLTPTERVERMRRAIPLILEMCNAGNPA